MSREFDPRYPPQQNTVCCDRQRWVVIGYLPAETQKQFWAKVKTDYPDIIQMRREGAVLIKNFNATFQITEQKYKQIMGSSG
jgi:ABC-type phosphate/phosphonate transport system substrate-binding protein